MNQSPPSLAAALTTRADLNGMANSRVLRRSDEGEPQRIEEVIEGEAPDGKPTEKRRVVVTGGDGPPERGSVVRKLEEVRDGLKKFSRFMGPGMMVCVISTLLTFLLPWCCGVAVLWWFGMKKS